MGDGWRARVLWRGGGGCGGAEWELCFGAGPETGVAYPLCRVVRLSKIRGGRLLTGIGGGGGTEGALRAGLGWQMPGAGVVTGRLVSRFRRGFWGFGRLRLGPGLPLFLQLPQVPHGGAEGTLQPRALHRDVPQHCKLFFDWHVVAVDAIFALREPREQPLGG